MAKRKFTTKKDTQTKIPSRSGRTRTVSSSKKFDKREIDDRDAEFSAYSKPNDAAWYAQNAQLMSDVASFSYNFPVGSKMPNDISGSIMVKNGSVPGIMTIHLAPRFGVVDEANDALNVAMRNLYSFVRHANSGSTNYEAPDLMLYLALMDSCFSFIEMLKRAYGTLMTYSFTNRYFPLAAVRAQGFDFVDLQENIADFRAYINTLAVKVGSMCIPASMSYMARHQWVYSGMYYDTPSDEKAQVYMYVPEAFYVFSKDADGAGAAQLVDFDRNRYSSAFCYPYTADNEPDRGWKFADIVDFGNRLIDPILEDEDFNVMSGDILKAFGASNVFMISTIPENYTVLPIYHEEVLNQIHNAVLSGRVISPGYREDFLNGVLPVVTPNNSLCQSSDKTYLVNKPVTHITVGPYPTADYEFDWEAEGYPSNIRNWATDIYMAKRFMDFESGPVSPAMAMVASRLMSFAEYEQFQSEWTNADDVCYTHHAMPAESPHMLMLRFKHTTCGSETAGYAKIWYWAKVGYNSSNDWALIHTEDIYSTMIAPYVPGNPSQSDIDSRTTKSKFEWLLQFAAQRKGLLSSFNMHPAIQDKFLFSTKPEPDDDPEFAIMPATWPQFDINYYTILDEMDVEQMHDTALLSEFNITQYGRKA